MIDGRFKTAFFTFVTVVIACSGSLVCGMWDEWFRMTGADGDAHRTVYQWGALAMCVPAGYSLSLVGRKRTIAVVGPANAVCWTAVLVWPSVPAVGYAAHLLAGMSKAIAYVGIPVYVGEVAEVGYRGAALTVFAIMHTTGAMIVRAAGLALAHGQLGALGLSLSVAFAVLFAVAAPESPYYCAEKDRDAMADMSLRRIRAKDDVSAELADVVHTVDTQMIPNRTSYWALVTDRTSWNALVITAWAFLTLQFCGYRQFIRSVRELQPPENGWTRPDLAFVAVSVIENVGNLITACLVDRVGRRPLMIVSYSAMATVQMAVAVSPNPGPRTWSWAPVAFMWLYGLSFGLGAGSLSTTLLGEMFPMNVKTKAVPLCVVLLFADVTNKMNVRADGWPVTNFAFVFYAANNIHWVLYTWTMTETRGKTFLEIQRPQQANTNDLFHHI